jgi:hypothetical protein
LLDLSTGQRRGWRKISPEGNVAVRRLLIARDGSAYAYNFWRGVSALFLAEGLK